MRTMLNSNVMTVLRVMADGKPRNTTELMEATGLSITQIERTVSYCHRTNMTTIARVTYTINELGIERTKWQPKPRPEPKRKAEPKAKALPKTILPPTSERLTTQAMANRPALQAVWGSM